MAKTRIALSLLALALPAPVQAQADATRPVGEARAANVFGTTGLLSTPTAYLQRSGQLSPFAAAHPDFTAAGLSFGLFNRLEIGATAWNPDHGAAVTLANAKLNLLRETLVGPAVSVG